MFNAERKMTLVMRVERPHERFMFMFSVVPASTPAIYIFRQGRRPRTRRRHSGRRNFKPKIPSVSEDNYLRKPSGNSSARPGRLQGRICKSNCKSTIHNPRTPTPTNTTKQSEKERHGSRNCSRFKPLPLYFSREATSLQYRETTSY